MSERATSSPLLNLPFELRNRIWRDHLRGECDQSKTCIQTQPKNDQSHICPRFALAMTCRQAYLEVVPIYYSEHNFRISCTIKRFSSSIGPVNANLITSISVPYDISFKSYTSHLPNLKKIDAYGSHADRYERYKSHFEVLVRAWITQPQLVIFHQCPHVGRWFTMCIDEGDALPRIQKDITTELPTYSIKADERPPGSWLTRTEKVCAFYISEIPEHEDD